MVELSNLDTYPIDIPYKRIGTWIVSLNGETLYDKYINWCLDNIGNRLMAVHVKCEYRLRPEYPWSLELVSIYGYRAMRFHFLTNDMAIQFKLAWYNNEDC